MEQKLVFRNPDLFPLLGYRQFIRDHMPKPKEGYVAEDIDLAINLYGENYGLDERGRYWLMELKYGDSWLKKGQKYLFSTIDQDLRESKRYGGFYVINYYSTDFESSPYFKINGRKVDSEGMKEFLNCPDRQERMRFPKKIR